MPPKELELLYFLASSPNQVFTREQLLDHIWGYEYIGDTRTVDVHIKRLREKIKDHPSWSISTVWGIGYKFEVKKYMRKSLYIKFVISYLILAFIGFFAVSMFGSSMVHNHLDSVYSTSLYQEATNIAQNQASKYYREQASLESVAQNLETLSKYQNVEIWLISKKGRNSFKYCIGFG